MQASGATNIKRTTLELGGKSPNVVMDDADSMLVNLYVAPNAFNYCNAFFNSTLSMRHGRKAGMSRCLLQPQLLK